MEGRVRCRQEGQGEVCGYLAGEEAASALSSRAAPSPITPR